MSLEQEIKLRVKSEDKIDLASLAWPLSITVGNIEVNHLISTYYETDDLHLSRHGVGLRMRQSQGRWLQTVKTSGVVKAGLHQREEWEHELGGPQWDLAMLRQTPLARIIDSPDIWSKLLPIFTTDFLRETIHLNLADGTQVELAYDRGQVIASDEKTRIHEIELELLVGNTEQLNTLASLLKEQLLLSLSNISKAQMGYQLVSSTKVQ